MPASERSVVCFIGRILNLPDATTQIASGCRLFRRTSRDSRSMIFHPPKENHPPTSLPQRVQTRRPSDWYSLQHPIQGARRPAKKDFAESSDPQLQSAVVVSKIDPIAIVAKAIWSDSRPLHQALICDENLNGGFCFYRPAQEGTKVILRKERCVISATSIRVVHTRSEPCIWRKLRSRISRMVNLNPPAKRLRIGLGREADSVDHIPKGVEELGRIKPIARLLLDRCKSTAPARKEEREIAATGAASAGRAPYFGISAGAAQGSPGIPTKREYAAEASHAPKQHRPARKERDQSAPANDAHILTNCGSEQRIAGEDGVFDPRATSLLCPIKHTGMIQEKASAV